MLYRRPGEGACSARRTSPTGRTRRWHAYTEYVDEAIYFTDDPASSSVHDEVRRHLDRHGQLPEPRQHQRPLVRNYPIYPIRPGAELPAGPGLPGPRGRAVQTGDSAVDAVMFRITSGKIPDELIRRHQAGVPVRLITDQGQYRNPTYFWDSYNVDRMHGRHPDQVEGQRQRPGHAPEVARPPRTRPGDLRLVELDVVVVRHRSASTTTSRPSRGSFDWFTEQFDRKWNNLTHRLARRSRRRCSSTSPRVPGNAGQHRAGGCGAGRQGAR